VTDLDADSIKTYLIEQWYESEDWIQLAHSPVADFGGFLDQLSKHRLSPEVFFCLLLRVTGFWWESPKERDHLKDLGVDERMGLGWILGR
jgi:hypothetical protein